jgi:hypothetical protein
VGEHFDICDESWLRLHDVRLRGMVTAPDDEPTRELLACGYATQRGAFVGLTRDGRDAHAVWARLPADSYEENAARRAYDQFLPLNVELLRVCTDWQLRPGGAQNDHCDAVYDWKVIDRLRELDERAGPMVRKLGAAVPRFAPYRVRLREALARIEDGEHPYFTGVACDSYHMVWNWMHEDLLCALGIDRASEPQPGT